MNITEIRVKLVRSQEDKLRGFASITLDDCLVIRDLKIIEGAKGLFVAMPSRKLHDRCPSCGCKNPLRARYCNDCGRRLRDNRGDTDPRGRVRLYADIAHPIHQVGRDQVQNSVVATYLRELEASKQEGYVEPKFEDLDYHYYEG
jgi:stage V sporulation protein G